MSSDGTVENKKVVSLIEIGKKFAVLVGINEYTDSSINRLNFSVKDIQDFHGILIDPEKGKYEEDNVKVLSDTNEEKPTRNNILSKLTTMSRTANSEDSILFYFSGHGAEIEGKPYLLCSDSYRNTIQQTALPNELIREIMENSLARVKIILLDACHSGVLKGVKGSGIMTKSFFESFFPPPEGFVALASCKLGESSHEWAEKEHGVFSYYLLEGLEGGADRDGDKIITITDAHSYTSENVKRWAFQRAMEQSPTLLAKISGDIPLVSVEKILKKEEHVDKSVIKFIILTSPSYQDSDLRDNLINSLCGSLLEFFKASEIESKVSEIKFPCGYISPHSDVSKETWSYLLRMYFRYEKKNWSRIDEIISFFDISYFWNSISFLLNRGINIEKLVQKCKKSSFEIVSFIPERKKESVTIDTEAWLGTKAIFRNLGDRGSEIFIFQPIEGHLETDFFSTLSPENILEFIKDCWNN